MRAAVKYSGAGGDFEEPAESSPREVLGELVRERPTVAAFGVLAVIVLVLIAAEGLHDVAQTTLSGLTLGTVPPSGPPGHMEPDRR